MKTYQIIIFTNKAQEQEFLYLSKIRNDIWNTFADILNPEFNLDC